MKLSEVKGEKALDMLADLIEPVSAIMADKEVTGMIRKGKRAKAISAAIKKHKKEVLEVMATLNGKSVKEYEKECNILSLPKQVLDIINDPAIFELFTSQSQETKTPSGSATENTVVDGN